MLLVSQGYPYTCTGIMAVVLGVIATSILSGSRLQVTGSMSTNTGLMPFNHNECVVATKLKGVVITSPVIRIASKAAVRGRVPLVNRLI